MVPTDCLMIQEPLVTRGMSLKVLLRRVCASLLSPPARNLLMHPSWSPLELPMSSASFSLTGASTVCAPGGWEKSGAASSTCHNPEGVLRSVLPVALGCQTPCRHQAPGPTARERRMQA